MAERQAILVMTPAEEAALARLIRFLCKMEAERGELSAILGAYPHAQNPSVAAIQRINSVLNENW